MDPIKNIFIAFLLFSSFSSTLAETSFGGCFVIKNGILLDYTCEEKEVIIPNNVVEIQTGALRAKGITKIKFPPGLKVIHSYSISSNKLTHVELPLVEEIHSGAFLGNKIETLIIPMSSLTIIRDTAFEKELMQEICPYKKYDAEGRDICATSTNQYPRYSPI